MANSTVGTGKIKFLDKSSNSGVISPESGGEDIYFEIEPSQPQLLREGQTVQFAIEETLTGPVAKKVVGVTQIANRAHQRSFS